jgi:aspartate/methionine/tyrosine aminotransferase
LTLGYTDPSGPDWLRAAIATGYAEVAEDDLVCFAGAQEALYATLHAILSPGDHAIVVLPSYQSMETLPLGLCAVSGVSLDPAADWSLDIEAVAAAVQPNTRVLTIGFPNNPTGKQLERDRFDALVALCRRHGIWLLSDEVYRLTERDPAHRLPCAADAYDRGISLAATSKSYGLPGLRIGWVGCRDPNLIGRLSTMRQYLSTCSAGPSEVLASIALKAAPAILGRNRAITEANLACLQDFFERHNRLFACRPPDGGMVCYPRYKGAEGVEQFVARMADTAGVLLLPSSVFRSDLLVLPADRFRIGFGHRSFTTALAALERALR